MAISTNPTSKDKEWKIKAKVFVYSVEATSWYFVSVGEKVSEEIKMMATKKVGFGFVPVEVTVGKTTWKTTLFPSKDKPYILALKKDVRRREDIHKDETVKISFRLI
ncbi:MAG: DUF1905 domain-containing protein [Candidatus Moranbacteria bacterium]|nr:DUF1905 domain-containing protein [Candidatus Moranbacteria bacterium]